LIIDGKLRFTPDQRDHRIKHNLCFYCGDPGHKASKCKIGSYTSKSSNEPKFHRLTGKVGNDGKLTPNERDRRIKENLCLYCEEPGHRVSTCNRLCHTATVDSSESTK
jgi:ribosomal protein L44E